MTENILDLSPPPSGRVQLNWSIIGTDVCNDGWRAELRDLISGSIQSGTSGVSCNHLLCFCAFCPPHADPTHELDGMKIKCTIICIISVVCVCMCLISSTGF